MLYKTTTGYDPQNGSYWITRYPSGNTTPNREFVETRQTLKALSVISRSLRSITQSILFEKLQIDLGTELGPRGSVDDLLANPRICAAIRFLELRGQSLFSSTCPRNDDNELSVIQKMLPEMVGLRKVSINQVNLNLKLLTLPPGVPMTAT